jgi:hypothetical protein
MRNIIANLTPASGRQDHTTSPSALQVRSSCAPKSVHRIPHPTFVTIAIRPLDSEAGRREVLKMICPTSEAKYFCSDDWTVDSALIAFWKFDFWRNAFPSFSDVQLHIVE